MPDRRIVTDQLFQWVEAPRRQPLHQRVAPVRTRRTSGMVATTARAYTGSSRCASNPDKRGSASSAHDFRMPGSSPIDSSATSNRDDRDDDQVMTCTVTWLIEAGDAGCFSADGAGSGRRSG